MTISSDDVAIIGSGDTVVPLTSAKEIDTMSASEYATWIQEQGAVIVEFKGSEWDLVGDKDALVDKPFVIAGIRFSTGDNGPFCSVLCYTGPKFAEKVVFNDGSTGVYSQLRDYVDKHNRNTGIHCKGLRVSRYQRKDPDTSELMFNDDGTPKMAATYYLK